MFRNKTTHQVQRSQLSSFYHDSSRVPELFESVDILASISSHLFPIVFPFYVLSGTAQNSKSLHTTISAVVCFVPTMSALLLTQKTSTLCTGIVYLKSKESSF